MLIRRDDNKGNSRKIHFVASTYGPEEVKNKLITFLSTLLLYYTAYYHQDT